MLSGHDQHQRIVLKRPGLQILGIHGIGDDPEVSDALAEGVDDTQARQLLQVDIHRRMLTQKVGEAFRQILAECGGIAQQADLAYLAFHAVGVVGQVFAQAFALQQDQPRMLGQRLAGRGEADATSAAQEERRAE